MPEDGDVPVPAGPTTKEILLDRVAQTVGEHALDTVKPSDIINEPDVSSPSTETFIPGCMSQDPTPVALEEAGESIMVGFNNECPRWAPGSVVKWAAWQKGFKKPADAEYAAQHLNLASQKWNELNVGVTFEWVQNSEEATFVLCYGADNGKFVAKAFPPNANDLNFFYVFSIAFSVKMVKDNLWKYFTHELGHVLGLRHEFAMDPNPDKPGEIKEFNTGRAAQIGPRDEKSVMNYGPRAPEIQQSDIDSTKAFYALREDPLWNPPRVGLTDIIDYTPM